MSEESESKNLVPLYTTGQPGEPSQLVTPDPNVPVYSAYTGNRLPSYPEHGTPTDAPVKTRTNSTYHGGIATTDKNGKPIYVVHRSEQY